MKMIMWKVIYIYIFVEQIKKNTTARAENELLHGRIYMPLSLQAFFKIVICIGLSFLSEEVGLSSY